MLMNVCVIVIMDVLLQNLLRRGGVREGEVTVEPGVEKRKEGLRLNRLGGLHLLGEWVFRGKALEIAAQNLVPNSSQAIAILSEIKSLRTLGDLKSKHLEAWKRSWLRAIGREGALQTKGPKGIQGK
jgi:hypothetical protein